MFRSPLESFLPFHLKLYILKWHKSAFKRHLSEAQQDDSPDLCVAALFTLCPCSRGSARCRSTRLFMPRGEFESSQKVSFYFFRVDASSFFSAVSSRLYFHVGLAAVSCIPALCLWKGHQIWMDANAAARSNCSKLFAVRRCHVLFIYFCWAITGCYGGDCTCKTLIPAESRNMSDSSLKHHLM